MEASATCYDIATITKQTYVCQFHGPLVSVLRIGPDQAPADGRATESRWLKLSMTHSDSRQSQVLDAAAHFFRSKGFEATSMRDIARAVGMLPGSLYCHFASKDDLLAAVYAKGVAQISQAVTAAVERHSDPWARLEAACIAHMESILQKNDYAKVVVRVRPGDSAAAYRRLVQLRDDFECLLIALIDDLPLKARSDRRMFRLMLLGAMNWSQTWYQPNGLTPRTIARRFVALLRD